jgi:hypothetical protein
MGLFSSRKGKAINIQAESAIAVTPGVTVFSPSTLFIGTGGNITVTTANGEAGVIFKNISSGSILPVLVIAVTAATATDIVRLS